MTKRPRLLIEDWFPMKEVGVECQREGSAALHPPVQRLHVYWARRPLAISRGAVLASLLPPKTAKEAFLRWMGIHGDALGARERIEAARDAGERVEGFSYPRAYTYTPTNEERSEFQDSMKRLWGTDRPTVMDPMAGGGSIPLEATRLGLPTLANDLNPLAHVVQKATVEYPALYGADLSDQIRRYAGRVRDRVRAELEACFPSLPGEEVSAYIWARTITCPHCAALVPLSPNWWLERDKAGNGWASMPSVNNGLVSFQVVSVVGGKGPENFNPAVGSIKRGAPLCPVCKQVVTAAEVKRQAQSGGMGQQLVAVVSKKNGARVFRAPTAVDIDGNTRALTILEGKLPGWEAQGLIPDEKRYVGPADRSANYGMTSMRQLFSRRQLLGHVVSLNAIRETVNEALKELGTEQGKAVAVYLAFVLDKCLDRNSHLSSWNVPRAVIRNTFDRHDFSMKWSFAEWNPISPGLGFDWATDQVASTYGEIARLTSQCTPNVELSNENASQLTALPDRGVDLVCVDPPYYDNVMYAELADFFYVWQKRILGDLFPNVFRTRLTNKDDEAVANVARFKGFSKSAKKLAELDYQNKMQAAFGEAFRVLRDDGALTIMFTHKKPEAWDSLSSALMAAGFFITASWPVRTEFEHSLHIASKNAAESTILLVCRKRIGTATSGWWEEIRPLVHRVVQRRVSEYEAAGTRGVDLYLASFGSALQVLGESWPVIDMEGNPVRPEVALQEARRAVTEHRMKVLVQDTSSTLDPLTKFVVLAWDAFRAAKFPFDEAHRLSLAIGVSADTVRTWGLADKSGKYLTLLTPSARVTSGKLKLKERQFDYAIDAIHVAMVLYEDSGAGAVIRFLEEAGLARSRDYANAILALLRALPPARPEYATLLRMSATVMGGQIDLTGLPVPNVPETTSGSDDEEDEDEEESEE